MGAGRKTTSGAFFEVVGSRAKERARSDRLTAPTCTLLGRRLQTSARLPITNALATWPAHFPFSFSRPLHRLVGHGDRLNLDQCFGRVEGGDLNDRVGRIRRHEIAPPQRDDLRKVPHVPEKDRDLDDIRQAGAAGPQHPLEVREDLGDLGVEVANAHELAGFVNGRLARDEQQLSDAIALGKAKGGVRIRVERDLLYLHRLSSSRKRGLLPHVALPVHYQNSPCLRIILVNIFLAYPYAFLICGLLRGKDSRHR
jgi:hypothetical protein